MTEENMHEVHNRKALARDFLGLTFLSLFPVIILGLILWIFDDISPVLESLVSFSFHLSAGVAIGFGVLSLGLHKGKLR